MRRWLAENFLGVSARKRVARDFFAALDALEKEGVRAPWAMRR